MPAFPFSTSVFLMTRKLDAAFAYLLHCHSHQSIEIDGAPSFCVSVTDRVRIKSLVEDTRVVAVEVAMQSGHEAQLQNLSESDEEKETDLDVEMENNNGQPWSNDALSVSISRIYKQTLEILGDALV